MIGIDTRIFGLVTLAPAGPAGSTPPPHGWLANLFNYLYGYNGLDAAYLTFALRTETLEVALQGFASSRKAEHLHVSPSCQEAVARFYRASCPRVDALAFDPPSSPGAGPTALRATWEHQGPVESWSATEAWIERARREIAAAFGREIAVPPDIKAALDEPHLRPCKMTHDDFEAFHAARRSA